MAKTTAVWGIDIGNSSLKALRCRPSATEPDKVEVIAFDFIEHSKILSQPGAEPAEILAETLQTFLSRNSVKGDRVAISVSGQNTISRFIKLPPVDPKKIPDIIKYEAKQWIPFDPQDVIWDFQPIGPPVSPTAVPMDSEVGMFAMKRDLAMKTLNPFLARGFNIDCIQSSPIALYNYIAFDQLRVLEKADSIEYDPDNPPDSVVLLCVGTDATDVVITNGYSIWIRSVAIGGNRFTQALTKGLKLTFSKAEYLKRNAAAAQDPKAVFQAMRPVFNDMLSEVHRSLEYYQSLNRRAKFSKILALGNAMKMPGLRQFLTQNLGYEVVRVPGFSRLVGAETLDSPLFKDNLGSFAVAYGLALQELDEASLTTNLVPKEIIVDRIVREKKPWALAVCAAILLGLTCQFVGASRALDTVTVGKYGAAENQAKQVQEFSGKMKSGTSSAVSEFNTIDNIGVNLTSNVEGRITWLELLRALNSVLPVEKEAIDDRSADQISRQNRIFISNIEAITHDDLATWFAPLKQFDRYYPDDQEILEAMAAGGGSTASSSEGEAAVSEGAAAAGAVAARRPDIPITITERLKFVEGPPAGTAGKVIQLVGYHYHNAGSADNEMGSGFVRRALLYNMKYGSVILPAALEKQMMENAQTVKDVVTMKELGLMFPTLMDIPKIVRTDVVNPRVILEIFMRQRREQQQRARGGSRVQGGGIGGGGFGGGFGAGSMALPSSFEMGAQPTIGGDGTGGRGGSGDFMRKVAQEIGAHDKISLRRFDFVVQVGWVETPPSIREKKLAEAKLAQQSPQEETTAAESAVPATETPAPVAEAVPPAAPTPDVEETPSETPMAEPVAEEMESAVPTPTP